MLKIREDNILPLIKGKTVLDLGNSWGHFKERIKSNAKSYKGLDIEPGADFQCDLNKPFELREKFDVIIAGELIEHLENTGVFLASVKKHLKKNGIFVLSTPNPTSIRFFFNALKGKEPGASIDHVKYFTHDSLKILLNRYFKIVRIGYQYCDEEPRKTFIREQLRKIMRSIDILIGSIFPRLADDIYVVCRNR